MNFVVNKEVFHDSKHYKKGQEISAEDKGFKALHSQGHLSEGTGKVARPQAEPEMEAEPMVEEKPVVKKGKK